MAGYSMKIRHLVFILLVAVVAGSLYNSQRLYHWYLAAYYQRFLGEDREKSIERARSLYRDERYEELDAYAGRMRVLYPDNSDLRRLKGFAMIKTGRESEGARMVISSLRKNEALLSVASAIEILFKEGEYADLDDIISSHGTMGDPYLQYIHGVSLYHVKKYAEAERRLAGALSAGKQDYDTLYYLGLAREKNGRTVEALAAIEKAYAIDPIRPEARKALVRLYRVTKQYDRAERIPRRTP